jgi:hypothetical protein
MEVIMKSLILIVIALLISVTIAESQPPPQQDPMNCNTLGNQIIGFSKLCSEFPNCTGHTCYLYNYFRQQKAEKCKGSGAYDISYDTLKAVIAPESTTVRNAAQCLEYSDQLVPPPCDETSDPLWTEYSDMAAMCLRQVDSCATGLKTCSPQQMNGAAYCFRSNSEKLAAACKP